MCLSCVQVSTISHRWACPAGWMVTLQEGEFLWARMVELAGILIMTLARGQNLKKMQYVSSHTYSIFILTILTFYTNPSFSFFLPFHFLFSVPGVSWLLCFTDGQKWYEGALSPAYPSRHIWGRLLISASSSGSSSPDTLLCLSDKGHQRGALTSLPKTGSCAQLPQLRPAQPVTPLAPKTLLPMEVQKLYSWTEFDTI